MLPQGPISGSRSRQLQGMEGTSPTLRGRSLSAASLADSVAYNEYGRQGGSKNQIRRVVSFKRAALVPMQIEVVGTTSHQKGSRRCASAEPTVVPSRVCTCQLQTGGLDGNAPRSSPCEIQVNSGGVRKKSCSFLVSQLPKTRDPCQG